MITQQTTQFKLCTRDYITTMSNLTPFTVSYQEGSLAISYENKHSLGIHPEILLLGIYPKELKTYIHMKSHIRPL